MKWKLPPSIKVLEALGAVADGRIHVMGNEGTVVSSSGNKAYTVKYDPEQQAIMTNDNGSYWQGYVGYPAIAYLMVTGVLAYDTACAEALKNIPWKELNTRFKNDFSKTEALALDLAHARGVTKTTITAEVERILTCLTNLHLEKLGKRLPPPKGE